MKNMHRVLLVEDDRNLAESLSRYLATEGFQVELASTISDAAKRSDDSVDIIVLDWMLPDGQGIDFLKELQARRSSAPVILLTSRTDLVDKVLGLESGANDYVTKPFEPRELVARIRVQLRKIHNAKGTESEGAGQHDVIEFGGVWMDLSAREVTYRDRKIELAKMEFELLKTLLESPNRVFPRESLLNKVWGYETYPTTRTVDNHIVLLRQKLDADLIETVRGVGYRLRDPKQSAKP